MRRIVCAICYLCISIVSGYAQDQTITLPEKPARGKYVDYSLKDSGWWIAAQITGGLATTNDNIHAGLIQVDIINGYRFSEFLKVGIGFSPRYYFSHNSFPLRDKRMIFGVYSLPIYADIRGNFISQEDTMFAPYWNADLGYSIHEGLFFSPGVGLKIGSIRHNVLFGVNYTIQGHNVNEVKGIIHIFSIRLGYEF